MVTLNLFDQPRRATVDSVVDRLNQRFDRGVVSQGQALKATHYLSHERILFGKPWSCHETQRVEFAGDLSFGAAEKTRTSTRFPSQAPQACASTIPPRPHRGSARAGV